MKTNEHMHLQNEQERMNVTHALPIDESRSFSLRFHKYASTHFYLYVGIFTLYAYIRTCVPPNPTEPRECDPYSVRW